MKKILLAVALLLGVVTALGRDNPNLSGVVAGGLVAAEVAPLLPVAAGVLGAAAESGGSAAAFGTGLAAGLAGGLAGLSTGR